MVWLIEFDESAKKDMKKLDRQIAKRISSFLRERVSLLDNPRLLGEALAGSRFGDLWKYRVGDYRIVCEIQDRVVKILVVKVGHRRGVYR